MDKELLLNGNSKYDLIFCDIHLFETDYDFIQEERNLNLKFIFMIYSMLRLNKEGTLFLTYGDIGLVQSFQIINNMTPYFDKIVIDIPETKPHFKTTGTHVIFKKYKGNFDVDIFKGIIDKIFKVDPLFGIDFMNINKHISPIDYKKVANIYIDDYTVAEKINKS